jgi:hypothetical protein
MGKVSRIIKDSKLDGRTLAGKAANNKLGKQKTLVKKFTKKLSGK